MTKEHIMIVPLFNYSSELYEKVLKAGILFSDDSILKLKCLGDIDISPDQQEALVNFELCKSALLKNSNAVYQSGSLYAVKMFEGQYGEWMLHCAFILELHDSAKYKTIAKFNSSSFVRWENDAIVTVRQFSELL